LTKHLRSHEFAHALDQFGAAAPGPVTARDDLERDIASKRAGESLAELEREVRLVLGPEDERG
jgi:hypothetical protein